MHIGDIVPSVIKALLERKDYPEMPTTLPALDKVIWGLHPAELLIIGGRPGSGKSALALQIAYKMSAFKNVAFLSLEMTKEQMVERILCNEYSLTSEDLRNGYCMEKIKRDGDMWINGLKPNKFLMVDDIGRTPESIENYIESLSPMPDVIFIDHLQHITVKRGNKLEALDDYVRFLKHFALRHKISIVLCSQLNRAAEDRDRPRLHHLKGCGSTEEVSDVVILLWNQEEKTTLLIEKQRNGPVGGVDVTFNKIFFRFEKYNFKPKQENIWEK